jgi:hypothetical protein
MNWASTVFLLHIRFLLLLLTVIIIFIISSNWTLHCYHHNHYWATTISSNAKTPCELQKVTIMYGCHLYRYVVSRAKQHIQTFECHRLLWFTFTRASQKHCGLLGYGTYRSPSAIQRNLLLPSSATLILVSCFMALCRLVGGYHFGRTCCLHL